MSDQTVSPLGTAGPPVDRTGAPPPNQMPTSPPDSQGGAAAAVPDPNSWQLVGPDGLPPQSLGDAGTPTHTPPELDPVSQPAGTTSSRPQQSQGASETAAAADLAADVATADAAGTDEGDQPAQSSTEGARPMSSTPNYVPPPISGGKTPDSSYNQPHAHGSGAAELPETPRPPAQGSTPVYDVRPLPDGTGSMDIDGDGRPDLPASAGGPPGAPAVMPDPPPAQGGTSYVPPPFDRSNQSFEEAMEDSKRLRETGDLAERAARAENAGGGAGFGGPATTFPFPPAEQPVAPGEQPPQTAPIDDRIRNLEPGEGGRPGIVYEPPFPNAPRRVPDDVPRGGTPAAPPVEADEPPAPPRNGEAGRPPVDEQPGYQDQPPPAYEQPGYQDQPPAYEQPGYQDQPPPAYEQPGYQDQPPPAYEQPGYQDQPPPADEQPGYQDQPPPADEQPGYQDQPREVAGEVAPDPADSAAPVPVASAPSGSSLDVFEPGGSGTSSQPGDGSSAAAGEAEPRAASPEPSPPPAEPAWTLTRDDAIAPPPQPAAATAGLEPVVFEAPLPAGGPISDGGGGIQEFDPDVARLIAWVRAAVADAAVMGDGAALADEQRDDGNILERILDWIRDALFQGGDDPSDADIAAQIQVLDAEEVAELYRQSLAMASADDGDLDD
ncbi:hypothetical protein O0235_13055 [Tepidiforma flava]|uniref:Uncharacterized protein n=1 Tax=Tepidiforma flava TaxID=3004094 RepID=A0ABY7M550_9CHLR|nr:hypothetical protein [Tepidiforma flava]WBL35692.1 hypothetical protein O0235_13055 [Tepidiforma flava]